MATVRTFARPVKTATHVHFQCGTPNVLIIGGQGDSKSYNLAPLASDFGRAFTLEGRVQGERYDVLIDGPHTSCTCKGWLWTGGCKHTSAILQLINEGRL